MKNLIFSRIGILFLLVIFASAFLACEKDDDPPDPSGVLPNVEFNYSSFDVDNGLEIDDYEAPTHVVIDFPVGYFELETWEKVEIDYGNGVITKIEPYDPRVGIYPVIYYSPGIYTITARVYNSAGMSELSKEIEILNPESLKIRYLGGLWSIIHEKVSLGSDETIDKTRKKYHSMFEFGTSDPQNYIYTRRDMHWLEEEYGSFTVNGFNINTVPENLSAYSALTLTVDSFYRHDAEVHLAMHTTMQDNDVGEILYEVDLILIDNDDKWGQFEQSILEYKWNIIEEETKIFAYSDQTMEYSDLLETIPKENIPYNHLTVDLTTNPDGLIIDNWNDGSFEKVYNFYRYRAFYRVKIGEYDSLQLIYMLFDPEYDNPDPNIYSLITAKFIEEDGKRLRVETKNKMRLSDGSEATIQRDSLVGTWEIIDKTETIDGNDVSPGNSETPNIGDVLAFNSDGSADLGGGSGEGWSMLDDCNFLIAPTGGGEILIHVNSYNGANGELEIMSITHDTEDDYKLVFGMEKL